MAAASTDGEAHPEKTSSNLTPQEKVALLLTAVRSMPELRSPADRPMGAFMYEVATMLHRSKLPLGEHELCQLLLSASHECGHGCDTRPPFDLARIRAEARSVARPRCRHSHLCRQPPGVRRQPAGGQAQRGAAPGPLVDPPRPARPSDVSHDDAALLGASRAVVEDLGADLVQPLTEWWPEPPVAALHGSGAQC